MARKLTYVSVCELDGAEPAAVVEAALHPERWLPQLRYVRELEKIAAGNVWGIGARYHTRVRAIAPYHLAWEMEVIEATRETVGWRAVGDLEGRARLEVWRHGRHTKVRTMWTVRPTARWMTTVWPLAHGLFIRNHDAIMRHGVRELADHLGADLVDLTIASTSRHEPRR